MKIKELLLESPTESGALKALFVSGPPGAGKTTIKQHIVTPPNTVDLDADAITKRVTGGVNYDPRRRRAVKMGIQDHFVEAVNEVSPLMLDTVGNNEQLMMRRIDTLKRIGYDVMMIWVDVSEETSQQRVQSRKQETGRHVDPEYITQVHQDKQHAIPHYQRELGNDFLFINNEQEMDGDKVHQMTQEFFSSPVQNSKGKQLLDTMKKNDFSTISPEILDVYGLSRILSSAWKP